MIAVVLSVAAKICLDAISQCRSVPLFCILEDGVKAPCRTYDSYLFVVRTGFFVFHSRVNGKAGYVILAYMLRGKVMSTFFRFRAGVVETHDVLGWIINLICSGLFFHILCLFLCLSLRHKSFLQSYNIPLKQTNVSCCNACENDALAPLFRFQENEEK